MCCLFCENVIVLYNKLSHIQITNIQILLHKTKAISYCSTWYFLWHIVIYRCCLILCYHAFFPLCFVFSPSLSFTELISLLSFLYLYLFPLLRKLPIVFSSLVVTLKLLMYKLYYNFNWIQHFLCIFTALASPLIRWRWFCLTFVSIFNSTFIYLKRNTYF